MPVPDIAPKKTGIVPTQYLDFDPENPRLIEDGIKNPTDAQIILSLADTSDLSSDIFRLHQLDARLGSVRRYCAVITPQTAAGTCRPRRIAQIDSSFFVSSRNRFARRLSVPLFSTQQSTVRNAG